MLKKKMIAVLVLSSMVGSTYAAGANSDAYFDGFYGQVEVGVAAQTNQMTDANSSYGYSETINFGNIQPQYAITAGYSKKIFDLPGDNDINLATSLSYNFSNGNSGSANTSYNGGSGTYYFNTKNIWSLSLEPGYYLSKHGLGYLKIGYAQGQTTFSNTGAGFFNGSPAPQIGTQSGYLLGFGFKHGLTAAHPNVFWGLEAYQVNMTSKTVTTSDGYVWTSKPSLVFGKVHLGYMF